MSIEKKEAVSSASSKIDKFILSKPWSVSRLGETFQTGKMIEVNRQTNEFSYEGKTYEGGKEITIALQAKNKNGISLLIPFSDKAAKTLLNEINKRVKVKNDLVIPKMEVIDSDEGLMKVIQSDMKDIKFKPAEKKPLPPLNQKLEVVKDGEGVVSKVINLTKLTSEKDIQENVSKLPKMKIVKDNGEPTTKIKGDILEKANVKIKPLNGISLNRK